MLEHDFIRCEADLCVYYKKLDSSEFVLLLLYVDDMLVTGSSMKIISDLKQLLAQNFSMKDLGAAKRILGMHIIQDRQNKEIRLSQEKYITEVFERFGMKDLKPVVTPLPDHFCLSSEMCPRTQEDKDFMKHIPYSSAVGSLMYDMICTRPDISHAVGVVSRFMSNLGKAHWDVVKWILRYFQLYFVFWWR